MYERYTTSRLVNKFSNLMTSLWEINFLGQENSLSIHTVYSPCFSHGFHDCSAKTKPIPVNEGLVYKSL